MKKLIKRTIAGAITLFAFSLSFNSNAGWDYKSQPGIDRIDGRTYFVVHCEDKLGDDCNMPGSASRTDITLLLKIAGL